METYVRCALDKNPNLADDTVEGCYDWENNGEEDNLPATMNSRCPDFRPGSYVVLDVERDVWQMYDDNVHDNTFDDLEQQKAIYRHDRGEPKEDKND